MSTLFYDHIINVHHIHSEIESLDITIEEKVTIINLFEDTIHHRIVHAILDRLSESDRKYFLELLHQKPHHDSVLTFLKSKIIGIEDKIKQVAEDVKYDTLKTIRQHT